ncbi:hypothetical protein KY285_010421 [Solanum tuberosum]|nr:hypothetical protein KY289_010969 [Solanum tuberosum]KAH0734714.1 hypothetical protein KY285_010421 [Solanum tuberosum]
MEKLFPRGLFTIMVHLVTHLATEAKLAGPVHYRWMYQIERYSDEIEHETSKDKCLFPTIGESYGGVDVYEIDEKTLLQAHRHVLFNCESEVVESYKKEHIAEIKRSHRKRRLTQHQLDRMHFDTFSEWFKDKVKELEVTSDILKNIKVLVKGPSCIAKKFNAYDLYNGYRFRTKQSEEYLETQNSGVMVISKTESYASSSDNAPKSANISYYGRLTEIVELNYYEEFKVVLFKCDWVDVTKGRGVMEDDLGNLEARKVCGPTLLKDIWKLPPGKTVDVPFNSRNQTIGKEGRKLSSFLGIIARTPELTPLHVDDWRNFDNEEKKELLNFVRKKFFIPKCGEAFVLKSLGKKWKDYKCQLKGYHLPKYKTKDALLKNRPSRIPRDQWSGLVSYWLSDKAKRRTQANRNNRTKQKMPHTGGSKSIAALMDVQTANGREPTGAEIFLLTHKQRVDGRPLDDDSAKVLGNERSGYVHGLGLGPTPSSLWGSRSFLENIDEEDSSNEIVQGHTIEKCYRLHYYPSHLKFKENTGDPKNTGLRKTTTHAEFATSGPGHTGTILTDNDLFKTYLLTKISDTIWTIDSGALDHDIDLTFLYSSILHHVFEPCTYTKAASEPECHAMSKEFKALAANDTWSIVGLPSAKKP